MARRLTRNFLENCNRNHLKAFLVSQNKETYAEETTNEMREAALFYFDMSQPDETPELQSQWGVS